MAVKTVVCENELAVVTWDSIEVGSEFAVLNIVPSCLLCLLIVFCRFADKTRNDWSARQKFVKHPGKYDMVEIDYNAQVYWLVA